MGPNKDPSPSAGYQGYAYASGETKQQHLVFKKCPANAKESVKTSHRNEHNFLVRFSSLTNPYISSMYEDQSEGRSDVLQRSIISKGVEGDLLTEVVYPAVEQRSYISSMTLLKYAQQMIRAVDFLHRNKVVHRDIKPTNVLV